MCSSIQNDLQFVCDGSMTVRVTIAGRKSCSSPCSLNHKVLNLLRAEKVLTRPESFLAPGPAQKPSSSPSHHQAPRYVIVVLYYVQCVPLFSMYGLDFSVEIFNTFHSVKLMYHIFEVPAITRPQIFILSGYYKSQKLSALADYCIS